MRILQPPSSLPRSIEKIDEYSLLSARRFDNYAAVMSVSEELLCAFELLKPLDAPALRKEMTKAKRKRYVPPFLVHLNTERA